MADLSICIVCKNRSKIAYKDRFLYVFPTAMYTLLETIHVAGLDVEIVIGDFESTDCPPKLWIPHINKHNIPIKLLNLSCKGFHRGASRNTVGMLSTRGNMYFMDSDMLVPPNVLLNGLEVLKQGKIYMPQCFYCLFDDDMTGWWDLNACGNVFVSRKLFDRHHWPAPPNHRGGHAEDSAYRRRIGKYGLKRKQEPNFIHQFHPGRLVQKLVVKGGRTLEKSPHLYDIPGFNKEAHLNRIETVKNIMESI